MRAIVLFIANSLDGYIAGPNDEIDWLFTDADYGYADFSASIDTVLQGRKTYEQALQFAEYPYPGKRNIVFSRTPAAQPEDAAVEFVGGDIIGFTRALQQEPGADIWLVGGGEIVAEFLRAGLIDRFVISIHPIILGRGIPLFSRGIDPVPLELVTAESFASGLVQLTYRRAA